MSRPELAFISAAEAGRRFRAGTLTPVELVGDLAERTRETDHRNEALDDDQHRQIRQGARMARAVGRAESPECVARQAKAPGAREGIPGVVARESPGLRYLAGGAHMEHY